MSLTCIKQTIIGSTSNDYLTSANFKVYERSGGNCVEKTTLPDFMMNLPDLEPTSDTCTGSQTSCGSAESFVYYSTGCSEDGTTSDTLYADENCSVPISISYCSTDDCNSAKMGCYADVFQGTIAEAITFTKDYDPNDTQEELKFYVGDLCTEISFPPTPTLTTVWTNVSKCYTYTDATTWINSISPDDYGNVYSDSSCSKMLDKKVCETPLCNLAYTLEASIAAVAVAGFLVACCVVCVIIGCLCCIGGAVAAYCCCAQSDSMRSGRDSDDEFDNKRNKSDS